MVQKVGIGVQKVGIGVQKVGIRVQKVGIGRKDPHGYWLPAF